MNQGVVTLRQHPKELPLDAVAVAARAQEEHSMLLEILPGLEIGSRLEIPKQFGPFAPVGLPKQFDQALALPARGRLFQGHLKEDGVPPTNLVVAVIADQARIVA